MTILKVLPTNTGEFKTIRTEKNLYIDKTEFLYSLIKDKAKKYFLSRPRRFGKSLTISTLEALFQGHKDMFEELWIYDKWDWKTHSVIRFDFSKITRLHNEETLALLINEIIIDIAETHEIDLKSTREWSVNLTVLLKNLKARGPVAILIDEYDSPFHKALDNDELLNMTKKFFSSFYELLKSLDASYDFLFVTGITKIAKTSIFSGMNTITDISYKSDYAALCGITQEELETYFSAHIDRMALVKGLTREETLLSLKKMYNGYRFSYANPIRVYNPFSLHHAFDSNEMLEYWFESGTPTLLINLIKNNNYRLSFIENPKLTLRQMRGSFDFSSLSMENLLFQTGYLTIDDSMPSTSPSESAQSFSLRFPNDEVKSAFINIILRSLREKEMADVEYNCGEMLKNALAENRLKDFADTWNQLLAHIPSNLHIPKVSYYHSLFVLFAMMFGFDTSVERKTSIGQIDMVIELADKIFVIEFKLNKPAAEALKQIHDKRYYNVYSMKNKPIFLLGISFDYELKKISELISEDLESKKVEIVFSDKKV